ncbi:MAG: LysM peptidoglycan-binding domain-containing protein [Luteolibacter sp.]
MTPIRILAPSLLAVVLASCASQKANQYDTPVAPAAADTSAVNAPVTQPANPVYDTPAAYEESSATVAPSANNPNIQASPSVPAAPAAAAAAPKAPSNGAAIIHTVVAGDTLSGISAKYKVSAAAIKQANGMTKDTVVLGKKMVIPPTH